MSIDVLLITPPSRIEVYQKLAGEYAAIEPPVWSSLIAKYLIKKNYQVKILDAEADFLSHEQTANEIVKEDPKLAVFMIYGQQPSASTQCMPGGRKTCDFVNKKSDNEIKSLVIKNPNLKILDVNGDLRFKYDYRQVYSTIIRDHLGVDAVKTQQIFNQAFERLPIYQNSPDQLPEFTSLELVTSVPNPVIDFALIQYSVFEKMQVKLAVYDLQGQEIQQIYQGNREIGSYQITVDLARISSGFYIISLSGSNGQRQSRRMIKQ